MNLLERNDWQWLLLHGCIPSVYRRLLKSELGSFITDYFQVLHDLLAHLMWSVQLFSAYRLHACKKDSYNFHFHFAMKDHGGPEYLLMWPV